MRPRGAQNRASEYQAATGVLGSLPVSLTALGLAASGGRTGCSNTARPRSAQPPLSLT